MSNLPYLTRQSRNQREEKINRGGAGSAEEGAEENEFTAEAPRRREKKQSQNLRARSQQRTPRSAARWRESSASFGKGSTRQVLRCGFAAALLCCAFTRMAQSGSLTDPVAAQDKPPAEPAQPPQPQWQYG